MSGFFSIFNSINVKSKVSTERDEIISRKEKETSAKLHCMICYKYSHELEFNCNDTNDDAYIEQSSNMFQNYVSLLCVQLNPSMHWNFKSEMLPFCNNCLLKVKNLTVLQNKLTFVMKQIKRSVLDMKIQILKSQKTIISEDVHTSFPGKDDIVEVEVCSSSSTITASKHKEKVDHFRSLVIKEFTPDVVVLREDMKKRTADNCHAKQTWDNNNPNSILKAKTPGETASSDGSNDPVESQGCSFEVVKSKYSDPRPCKDSMKFSNDKSFSDEAIVSGNGTADVKSKSVIAQQQPLTISENIFEKNENKDLRFGFKNGEISSLETERILKELVIIRDVKRTTYAEAQILIKKIGGNSNWQCKLCKKRFIARHGGHPSSYVRHIDTVHKNIKPFQCRLCPHFRFYERRRCLQHIKSVHANYLSEMNGNSSWNLPELKDSTNTKKTVDRVNISERNIAYRNTKSDKMECDKLKKKPDGSDGSNNIQKQRTATAIYRQFYTHRSDSNHYNCKFCSSKIMFKCNLKRHFLNYHGPLNKFKCQHCQRIFSSERMHIMHLKSDHKIEKGENNDDENQTTADNDIKSYQITRPQSELPLQSRFVNKPLLSGEELAVNKIIVGEDTMDIEDSRSSLTENDSSENLTISTSSNIVEKSSPEPKIDYPINVNEKRTNRCKTKVGKCDTRNYEYPPHIERGIVNARGNLVTNIDEYFEGGSVKGDKVRCKVCSVVVTKGHRHRHYVSVHSKVGYPYKCKYCQKHFYYKYECALHIRISHYMEKPFQCSQCSAAFTTVNSRAIHMRKCSFLSSTSKSK